MTNHIDFTKCITKKRSKEQYVACGFILVAGLFGPSCNQAAEKSPVYPVRPGEFVVKVSSQLAIDIPAKISALSEGTKNKLAALSMSQQQSTAGVNGLIESIGDNTYHFRTKTSRTLSSHQVTAQNIQDIRNELAQKLGVTTSSIDVIPVYVGHLVIPKLVGQVTKAADSRNLKHTAHNLKSKSPTLIGNTNALKEANILKGWKVQGTAPHVIVAVLDSGIMLDHEDLKGMFLPGYDAVNLTDKPYPEAFYKFSKLDDTGRCVRNEAFKNQEIIWERHGTHVSGIIGANCNNGVGIKGVACNVKIIPVKVAQDAGTCSSIDMTDAVKGINYAVDHGAKIINASWSGFPSSATPIKDAIERARLHGAIFVNAAGNDSMNLDVEPSYPASWSLELDNMIVVASVDRVPILSDFSDWGAKTVNVAAPGSVIWSTIPGQNAKNTQTSEYAAFNGTSQATPHVVGIAALLAEKYPSENYKLLRERIITAVSPKPALKYKIQSAGVVDLYGALTAKVTSASTGNSILSTESARSGMASSAVIQVTDSEKEGDNSNEGEKKPQVPALGPVVIKVETVQNVSKEQVGAIVADVIDPKKRLDDQISTFKEKEFYIKTIPVISAGKLHDSLKKLNEDVEVKKAYVSHETGSLQ